MEAMEIYFKNNPQSRAILEKNKSAQLSANNTNENEKTASIITIPVVVHLLLSSADQALVTEADVIWQINKMNEDYAGTNADSTNGGSFYSVRGHSQIRFCLARQDVHGNPSNGINRITSSITEFTTSNVSKLKHASSCGTEAWDPARYLNIWVAHSSSILGIATFPGVGPEEEQGIAISLDGFSNNPAYVKTTFNRGRTMVHEVAHYLGLYHIWGDEGGCTNSDFRQLPGNCLIAGSDIVGASDDLLVGDTPNQGGPTTGCISGERTDVCTSTSPGIQYQNFMDYTDDACYSMFTNLQAKRMEYVLNNCRPLLGNSIGCIPVPQFANDVAITSILNPGQGSCGVTGNTSFCSGTAISPVVEVTNFGAATIKSLQFTIQVDGAATLPFKWMGLLKPYETIQILLPSISAVAAGTHVLKIEVEYPNGMIDEKKINNVLSQAFVVDGGLITKLNEGFEGNIFPPTGWRIINEDNAVTWEKYAGAGYNSSSSARINIYNYKVKNSVDLLVAPSIQISNKDSIRVSFQLAHASYYSPDFGPDTLELVFSTDCGLTWKNFGNYKKWSNGLDKNNLATSSSNINDFIPTTADQWRLEKVSMALPSTGSSSQMLIAWKSTSMFGNNIYIDDVIIEGVKLVPHDAAATRINNFSPKICQSIANPEFVFANAGTDTLRSLQINFVIDNGGLNTTSWTGNLPPGVNAFISLKNINLGGAGKHLITYYTSEPNGLIDGNKRNDTLLFAYEVFAVQPLTYREENFSSPLFPPTGWSINNPDQDVTWQRNSTVGKKGAGSAWLNNFYNKTQNRFDDLVTPNFSYDNIDSVFFTFQMASAAQASGTFSTDTLTVLLSKDCGNSFIPVYKKWGDSLQTINDPTYPRSIEFFPMFNAQWRKDSVNLGTYLSLSESHFQLLFRLQENYGNNIFIDDVTLYTKTLPAIFKEKGYLILPTVTRNIFSVWHYLPPTNLRSVIVLNSIGQIVWKKEFKGSAEKLISIDLGSKAAGIYTVSLQYTNKMETVTQKIIKY